MSRNIQTTSQVGAAILLADAHEIFLLYEMESFLPDCFQKLVTNTVINWAKSDFISDQDLIREMFSLLHRQYDCVGEVSQFSLPQNISNH